MSSAAITIKDRLGIVEVVQSYIKLEKAGANYKARCPFHNEKSPSFFVSPARNSYYCFGCGAKGDIFTFVQEFEKIDFLGALKILADRAGIELEQFKFEKSKETELDVLRNLLEKSTKYYEANLFDSKLEESQIALDYLKSRGLTMETIKAWRIGLALNTWRGLHDSLAAHGETQKNMELVGLVKTSGSSVYDRFRSRIMFPLFDASGRVIGYSGRYIVLPNQDGEKEEDGEAAKYLNSPETPLFNKSEVLYGYHRAKEGIRKFNYTILVEGQMDMLMCHQNGFNNAVATSGTALTERHLEKTKRLSDNVMIAYDSDKAGLNASLRAWQTALHLRMDVKIASLPNGEDPASILLKDKEIFKEALKKSSHIIDFTLDNLLKQGLDDRKLWKAVETSVLPYVLAIDSAIDKTYFINRISLKTRIPEDDLKAETERLTLQYKELHKETANRTNSASGGASGTGANGDSVESKMVIQNGSQNNEYAKASIETSLSKDLNKLAGMILWLRESDKKEKADEVLEEVKKYLDPNSLDYLNQKLSDSPPDLIFEAEVMFAGSSSLNKDIEELTILFEERVYKQMLSDKMVELNRSEKLKDKDAIMSLLLECQELSKKISEIQRRGRK